MPYAPKWGQQERERESESVLGPHILSARVSGCYYLNIIPTRLSELLEDVAFSALSHVGSTLRYYTTTISG
jgi:hypothetical protein